MAEGGKIGPKSLFWHVTNQMPAKVIVVCTGE